MVWGLKFRAEGLGLKFRVMIMIAYEASALYT